jgi:hypothetical protein
MKLTVFRVGFDLILNLFDEKLNKNWIQVIKHYFFDFPDGR